MKTFLMQGDSITDCYRPYDNDAFLGSGYPELVKAELQYEMGKEIRVLNRGISGNRVSDLYARVKCDLINLKPDYLSVLIGVNDALHEIDWHNGLSAEKYETVYSLLIETVKEELPEVKIFLLEPFVLEHSYTKNSEEMPDRWNRFHTMVTANAAAARRVAEKYGLPFIPLQNLLDEAAERLGVDSVSEDGIHPTAAGHKIIADELLKCFRENM